MHPLEDARKRRLPWHDVARAVRQLENANSLSGRSEPPLRTGERLSGYSGNQLRRMLAGLAFLDELAADDPATAEWLGVPRFSIAEMLAKLWRQDKDATSQLLQTRPTLRYEALYKLFHDGAAKGASPGSAGKQAGRQFREHWLKGLLKDPGRLAPFGPGCYSVIQPRSFHRYCKPTLLLRAEISRSTTRWAGIDFIDRPIWDDDAMWRRLMLIATESTFLDLWSIFVARHPHTSGDPKDATDRTSAMVHELSLRNVFVIPIMDEGFDPAPYYSEFRLEPPSPDRRNNWHPPNLTTTLAQYVVASD